MERLWELVAEMMEVEVSEISMETLYNAGKWDSLMMLTLVMEPEAEYGVSIPMESIGGIKTMMDLYKFVK